MRFMREEFEKTETYLAICSTPTEVSCIDGLRQKTLAQNLLLRPIYILST